MHGSFVVVLGFFFSLLKFKNPCNASKSKHIFNDGDHYYFTIKLFYVGLSCIICESTDVQVAPVKESQKTWQLMEIQILEKKRQKQAHYHPVIWACSPKRCYQLETGPVGRSKISQIHFLDFVFIMLLSCGWGPVLSWKQQQQGEREKKRLDCCWT